MGECEVCGAMNVGTRQVPTGRTTVAACKRCADRVGPKAQGMAPGLAEASRRASTGPAQRAPSGIMRRSERVLTDDFGTQIRRARSAKGWSQDELARRMSEKVNIVKAAESGRRPTDGVVSKFERVLGISLMVDYDPEEHRRVQSGQDRGFTLGDYLDGLR